MNEYKIEIDRTSVEKISNAKISAEDLIKEAKNKSILKIEESRKDLSSAKILNKLKNSLLMKLNLEAMIYQEKSERFH